MKLVLAIVQDDDALDLIEDLGYYLFNDETTVYDCRSVTHIG